MAKQKTWLVHHQVLKALLIYDVALPSGFCVAGRIQLCALVDWLNLLRLTNVFVFHVFGGRIYNNDVLTTSGLLLGIERPLYQASIEV